MDCLIRIPHRDLALVKKEKLSAIATELFFSIPQKGLEKITKATGKSISWSKSIAFKAFNNSVANAQSL